MSRTVDGHKAALLIDRALDDYMTDMTEVFFKAMSNAGKRAKKELNIRSPKLSGGYAKGWAIRTKRERYGINVLIYNKAKPGLTHLLEKGHAMKNGGRAPAYPHISIAREIAEEYLLDELTRNL